MKSHVHSYPEVHKMDLGVGDVHIDSTPKRSPMEKRACKACMAENASDAVKCSACGKSVTMEDGAPSEEKTGTEEKSGDSEQQVEATYHADSIELSAKSAEGKEIWIQVAKQGEFRGHAAGAFKMNAQTWAEIIANFEASKNRAIPVDFEHASEQSPTSGNIPLMGAPAQGWIKKLTVRDDGNLWGLVEWGKLAREYIKNGQYKFLSPAIVFGAKDRVTGKSCGARLSSVALTNNPFLDGMQPVAASAKLGEGKKVDEDVVKVIASIAVGEAFVDKATPEFVNATLRLHQKSPTSHAHVANKLRDALRLPLTMSLDDVFAAAREATGEVLLTNSSSPAVPAAIETQPPATALKQTEAQMGDNDKTKEMETQVSSLTLKLNAAEAEKVTLKAEFDAKLVKLTEERDAALAKIAEFETKEIDGLVTAAIQVWGDKKGLTEASKPHLMRLAKNDREAFDALYPAVPAGQRHLSQKIATGQHNVPGNQIAPGGTDGGQVIKLRDVIKEDNIPSLDDMVAKLMTDNKQMTREEAYSKAFTQRIDLVNKAASTRLAGNGG